MKPFDYAIASTRAGAVKAAAAGYRIKAAGIDILDQMKERTTRDEKLVSIHRLRDLASIRASEGGLEIGALATLARIGADETVRARFAALAHAAGDAATPQVRARATIGGNILQRPRCWYFRANEFKCLKKGGATCYAVDGENEGHALFGGGPCHITHPSNVAPVLVAANAEIVILGAEKERRVSAGEFFVLPQNSLYRENTLVDGELVTAISIPVLPEKSGYVEFRQKQSFDWPLAACTAVYTAGKWSVVLSHVAPIPWQAKKSEEVLAGAADVSPDLAERAADAALDGAEPMSQNSYRLQLVRASVRRALLQACGKDELA